MWKKKKPIHQVSSAREVLADVDISKTQIPNQAPPERRRFAVLGKLTKNLLGSFHVLEKSQVKQYVQEEEAFVSLYERFVSNPENLNVVSAQKLNSQLWTAVEQGQEANVIHQIIQDGGDQAIRDASGNTLLHLCGKRGHHHLIRYFVEQQLFKLDVVNNNGENPVQYTTNETTKLVFLEGTFQALLHCAKTDQLELFRGARDTLARFSLLDKLSLIVALHVAAAHGSVCVLEELLNRNDPNLQKSLIHSADPTCVDVNATTAKGLTALHYAVQSNQYRALRVLLENGADPNREDSSGKRPIDLATTRIMRRTIHFCTTIQQNGQNSSIATASTTATTTTTEKEQRIENLQTLGDSKRSVKRRASNYFDQQTRSDFVVNAIVSRSHLVTPAGVASTLEFLAVRKDQLLENLNHVTSGESMKIAENLVFDTIDKVNHYLMLQRSSRKNQNASLAAIDEALSTERFCNEVVNVYDSTHRGINIVSFMLTNDRGDRTYCYTTTLSSSQNMLKTLCVCSKWPLLSYVSQCFSDATKSIQQQQGTLKDWASKWLALHFVQSQASIPQVNPATTRPTIQVVKEIYASLLPQWPGDIVALPFVDDNCFRILFAVLRVEHVLQVIAALLTEQSVVIMSSNIALIGPACEALTSLLFPFQWRHTYIPLLPTDMLEVVHAPSPFLIGVHAKNLEAIGGERLTSLVIVNIDVDSIVQPIDPNQHVARGLARDSNFENGLRDFGESSVGLPPKVQQVLLDKLRRPCNKILCGGKSLRQQDDECSTLLAGELANSDLGFLSDDFEGADSVQLQSHANITSNNLESNENIHVSLRDAQQSNLPMRCQYGSEIQFARNEVFTELVKMIGPVTVHDCTEIAQQRVLDTQDDWDMKCFLKQVFSTALFGCLASELQSGSENLERELQLEALKQKVDEVLELEQCRVLAKRVVLYQRPNFDSQVVGCKHADDIFTIAQRKEVRDSKSRWFKLREVDGWCLVEMGKDAIWIRTQNGERVTQDAQNLVILDNARIYQRTNL